MIQTALYEYLTVQQNLTGHPALRFESPVTVGFGDQMKCRTRNDARRYLQSRVAGAVSNSVRPTGSHSITIHKINSDKPYELAGENDLPADVLQLDVWGKGASGYRECQLTARLLQLCVTGYRGYWGDRSRRWVESVTILREGEVPMPPANGSADWAHRINLDIEVIYREQVIRYATDPIAAGIAASYDVGTGIIRLGSKPSFIPAGYELATVHWNIGNGDLVFSGKPGTLIVGVAGVSGTYDEPTIDSAAAGLTLPSTGILTITDDANRTATASVAIGGDLPAEFNSDFDQSFAV